MRNKHRYSEDWADSIRPAILKRDNYKCQHCNIKHKQWVYITPNGEWVKVEASETNENVKIEGRFYKVFLQVAHKDNNPGNNNPQNLISLCSKCHLAMDKAHRSLVRLSNKGNNKK